MVLSNLPVTVNTQTYQVGSVTAQGLGIRDKVGTAASVSMRFLRVHSYSLVVSSEKRVQVPLEGVSVVFRSDAVTTK